MHWLGSGSTLKNELEIALMYPSDSVVKFFSSRLFAASVTVFSYVLIAPETGLNLTGLVSRLTHSLPISQPTE